MLKYWKHLWHQCIDFEYRLLYHLIKKYSFDDAFGASLAGLAGLLASFVDVGGLTPLQIVLDVPLTEQLHPVTATYLLLGDLWGLADFAAVFSKGVWTSHLEAVHQAKPLLDLDGPFAGLSVELGLAGLAQGRCVGHSDQGNQEELHCFVVGG